MFPYKMATIHSGFAFGNNIESLNFNFIVNLNSLLGVSLWGRGFWAMGARKHGSMTQSAVPNS